LAARKFKPTTFPTHKFILIYGRQSTKNQYISNVESAKQQAIELLDYALELGWPDELRKLWIENQLADGTIKNASGRLAISEREGLTEVYSLIKSGKAGAVLVRKIDRLFRDEDMVDPAVFAKACREHHVLILTLDGDIFDFNNKPKDYERFLREAQEAANFLGHIKLMSDLRNKKGLRGEFNGHIVPTGLMLSDDRKHYVANPEWAPIMKKLLKRFRELDGNFAQLRREVVGKPIFKDLPDDIKKRVGKVTMLKVPGGYTVKTPQGLKDMMCNVALIGHTKYNGRLIRNTHTGIVDEDDFWFSFYQLSDYDIDGHRIERDRKIIKYVDRRTGEQRTREQPTRIIRYSQEPSTALLHGVRKNGKPVITSPGKSVYVHQNASYTIKDYQNDLWGPSISVSFLDKVFTERLLERLDEHREKYELIKRLAAITDTLSKDKSIKWVNASPAWWAQYHKNAEAMKKLHEEGSPYFQLLAMQQEDESVQISSVSASIAETKQTLARLQREHDVEFDLMSDKELRENKEARIRLAKRLADLEQEQAEEDATLQGLQDVGELLQDVYTVWSKWKPEKKQRFIRMATESIELDEIAEGWLTLTIHWAPFLMIHEIDVAFLRRQNGGTAQSWTTEEEQIIRTHYPTASRKWILEQLPNRGWAAIMIRAYRMGLNRQKQPSDIDIPDWMCIMDKQAMDTNGLVLSTPDQCVWWTSLSYSTSMGLSR